MIITPETIVDALETAYVPEESTYEERLGFLLLVRREIDKRLNESITLDDLKERVRAAETVAAYCADTHSPEDSAANLSWAAMNYALHIKAGGERMN